MNQSRNKGSATSRSQQNKKNGQSPSAMAQLKSQLMRELRREMGGSGPGRLPKPLLRRGPPRFLEDPARSGAGLSRSVQAPVARGSVRRVGNPQQQGLANGDLVVAHREYIEDVSGTVAFTAQSNSINPGLPGLFPWLSGVAQRFESYKFEKLVFDYETQAPTSATGTNVLAIDYDASDVSPTTKTQAMAFRSSVRSPSWSDASLSCLKEDLDKRTSFFVRKGANPTGTDVKLYDVGNLFVCTQGQANTNAIGELYVEYRIRLMTPELGNVGQGEAVWGEFNGTSNAAPASVVQGNLPVTYASTGSTTSVTTWTFTQPWQGIISWSENGTGITAVTLGGTATTAAQSDVLNAAATAGGGYGVVTALINQTVTLTVANTTLTVVQVDFSQSGATI
jgi:hypothetical protein